MHPSPQRSACPGLDPGPGPDLTPRMNLGPGLRRGDVDSRSVVKP
jgi:hypothetical protein